MSAAPQIAEDMSRIAAQLDVLFAAAPRSGYRQARDARIPELAREYSELAWQCRVPPDAVALPDPGPAAPDWLAQPVFILGVPRSGTSLLLNLLDGHPELAVLPAEGNLLTQFRRPLRHLAQQESISMLGRIWIARLIHGANLPPYWLLGPPDARPNPYVVFAQRCRAWSSHPDVQARARPYDAFLPVVLAWALREGGGEKCRAWVEKTPYHERVLGQSLRAFPAARCLHVVRDPRAVLRSRQTVERNVNGSAGDAATFAREIGQSLASARRNAKRLGPARYRVLHYEALQRDPAAAMRDVAEFLGIRFDECLLRPTVGGRPTASNSSHAVPPAAGVIHETDASATTCDAGSLALLRRHAGRAAARLGYVLGG